MIKLAAEKLLKKRLSAKYLSKIQFCKILNKNAYLRENQNFLIFSFNRVSFKFFIEWKENYSIKLLLYSEKKFPDHEAWFNHSKNSAAEIRISYFWPHTPFLTKCAFFHQKIDFFQRRWGWVQNHLEAETRPESRSEYDGKHLLKVSGTLKKSILTKKE